MPRQRITKDMVVEAAFDIARRDGMDHVIVTNIAERLGCSVQPIYSYCRSMDGLRAEVCERANAFIRQYVAGRIDPSDLFRSTGRAYLHLAKDEPNILKIFVLQERDGVASLDDLYRTQAGAHVAPAIASQLGISVEAARRLHLNMLIYTIGLGTIFAVTRPGIPAGEMEAQQERAYDAFLAAALKGEEL